MRYTIIASVEAGSMEEAWRSVENLPLSLTPGDLEEAVGAGVRSMKIFSKGGDVWQPGRDYSAAELDTIRHRLQEQNA